MFVAYVQEFLKYARPNQQLVYHVDSLSAPHQPVTNLYMLQYVVNKQLVNWST